MLNKFDKFDGPIFGGCIYGGEGVIFGMMLIGLIGGEGGVYSKGRLI